MRLAKIQLDGRPEWGTVEGDEVVMGGSPLLPSTIHFGVRVPVSAAVFLPPVTNPSKIVAIGRNFRAHTAEMGWAAAEDPVIFLKAPSSLIGAGQPIVLPEEARLCEPEGELAIIIGTAGRRIPVDRAREHIFGYTIANDVSARDLMTLDGQWSRAKGFDSFCPLGPWIETELDPTDLQLQTFVEGRLVQDGRTADMVISPLELVSHVSQCFSLEAGDVIICGSPAGRAPLSHGSLVQVSIHGIGTLHNPVLTESRATRFVAA